MSHEARGVCDDYEPPLTCWTVPSGRKTLICGGCRESLPNGAEVQALYLTAIHQAEARGAAAVVERVEAVPVRTVRHADGCAEDMVSARDLRAALTTEGADQ